MTKEEIKSRLFESLRSCPHREAIKSLAIFGSYVNGTPSEDSDIDVLVDLEPGAGIGFFGLSDIKDSLELSVRKPVDLLTIQAISKYFRDEVLAQAEYIYEK